MTKKRPKRNLAARETTARLKIIEEATHRLSRQKVVDLLVGTCKKNEASRLYVESVLAIELPPDLVCADVMAAIIQATEIDESQINRNFDYDYQAYTRVSDGFKRLIKLAAYSELKVLALELMKRGSYQIERSDEGLMLEDIEACLSIVIKAIKSADTEGGQTWAESMMAADQVGFICDSKLKKMSAR